MISSSQRLNKLFNDRLAAIGVFLLFLATAAFLNIPTPETLNLSFGWEYGNIAGALVEGKGFSNAFTSESGATAWMPPLFVFMLAGIFYAFGIKTIASMWAVFVLKYAALAACVPILLSTVDRTGFRKYRYLSVMIFLGLIYLNLGTFFRSLHDEWLILFLICSALSVLVTEMAQPSKSNTIHLYILAFILPLANPILAVAFLITAIGSVLVRDRKSQIARPGKIQIISLLILFAASTLLWTVRNYQTFGRVIPVKSNFWFDFYQANVMDDDGLTTNATFEVFHPIHTNAVQEQYLIEGENLFTDGYQSLALDWIASHPGQLLQNIIRRAFSAFLYMHQSDDILPANHELLTAEDVEKLKSQNLVSVNQPPFVNWTSLTMPEGDFRGEIETLNLSNEPAVIEDWSNQRAALLERFDQLKLIVRSLVMSLVPFLCLITGIFVERIRKNPVFLLSAVFYLTYLIPYVLVSHYRRYQVPLIGLQSVFIFLLACILLDRFASWRRSFQGLFPSKQKH
jgi:hypothetical protein